MNPMQTLWDSCKIWSALKIFLKICPVRTVLFIFPQKISFRGKWANLGIVWHRKWFTLTTWSLLLGIYWKFSPWRGEEYTKVILLNFLKNFLFGINGPFWPNLALNMTDAYSTWSVLRMFFFFFFFFWFCSFKGAKRYWKLLNAFSKKTLIQRNLAEEIY